MHEITKSIIVLKLMVLLTACGGGGSEENQSTSSAVIEPSIIDVCEYECSTSSVTLDSQLIEIADTPFENNDRTNASINVDIYQDSETDNFVFTSISENISIENSVIHTVETQFKFGDDIYPELVGSYELAAAPMVYYYTNNAVPYIWSIQFRIEMSDGDVYEGTATTGETVAARTFLPDEFTGNKISNFSFTLLESSVENSLANVKYKVSFNFEVNGAIREFEQVIHAQNNGIIANQIPKE